jgi:hypothetical protein
MTSFKSEELTIAVHAALRTAASLSSGSMVYPYNAEVVWEETRAKKGSKPLQWLLERETFEQEVATQYANLQNGVVRELVAGTGVGKTTVLPFIIARNYQVNGLVLMPNATYTLRTVNWVVRKLQQTGDDVRAVMLRSSHTLRPPKAPVVYFSDADTMLGRLARNKNLLQELGIDFIFLDESHSSTPGYKFFEYAVTAGIVANCKVFYGTATASADMSMEDGSAGRAVQAVKPSVLCADNPRMVTEASPLHYQNVQARTMVILATDQEIISWYDYYDSHDVPVCKCLLVTGHRAEEAIDSFLAAHNPAVLLVTGKFRTSVTLNIECVIDCGYELKAVSDFHASHVALKKVPITAALRTQSMGRVGRFKPGRGYYADVECTEPSRIMDDDTAFYIYLWSVVFNLKINDSVVSQFAGLFTTPLSRIAAAHLLHVRMTPLLMVPYVGDEGFYRGWHEVAKYVLYQYGGVDAYDDTPVDTSRWTEYTTGPVDYCDVAAKFRSAVMFPREWNVLPAFAWAIHQGDNVDVKPIRARSVISAVPTEFSVKVDRNKSRESLATVTSHGTIWTDGRTVEQSAATLRIPTSVRGLATHLRRNSAGSVITDNIVRVPKLDDIKMAYSVRDTIPAVSQPLVSVRPHARGQSVDETHRTERIHQWNEDTVPKAGSVYRVNSDSSDDRMALSLRQVDPVKYKHLKLYPMDTGLFDELVASEAAGRHDRGRVEKLLTGSENIVDMRGDASSRREKQSKYFLSVVRVHNSALIQKYQLAANSDTGLVSRVKIYVNGNEDVTDTQVNRTAKLLQAFQLENYYVGIDRRARRSEDSLTMFTPDYDYEESRARIMMAFGPSVVVNIMEKLLTYVRPYFRNGRYAANAWQFNGMILSAQHPYEDDEKLPTWAGSIVEMSAEDDFVVFSAVSVVENDFKFRDVTDPENVYIVTYDKTFGKAVILGDYVYRSGGDIGYVSANLAKGASGALLVAVSDGAILGMYVAYMGVVNNEEVSIVVPSGKFAKFL